MDQGTVKREDYVECKECTKKFGKVTYYPKHALSQGGGEFFEEDAGVKCPFGHAIEEKKA